MICHNCKQLHANPSHLHVRVRKGVCDVLLHTPAGDTYVGRITTEFAPYDESERPEGQPL